MLLWVFWLLVGFPQITGESYLPRLIPLALNHDLTYVLNRATKFVLWLAYLTLFPTSAKSKAAHTL